MYVCMYLIIQFNVYIKASIIQIGNITGMIFRVVRRQINIDTTFKYFI